MSGGEGDGLDVRPGASVRLKLVIFAMTIVALAGGAPATFTIMTGHRDSRERIESQLEQLARLVATGGVFADGSGGIDGRALRSFVHNAESLELPVTYVLVEDAEGNIDESLGGVNVRSLKELSPELARAWERGEDKAAVLEELRAGDALGGGHLARSMQLVQDGSRDLLGRIRVGMSTLEADRQTRDAVVSSALLVGVFLVFALVLSASTAGRLVRPLQRLSSAMQKVADGDLDQDLPPPSGDEVGQLTAAFNTMTAGLRQRERLRATLGRYVSSEVAERILTESDDLDLRGEVRDVTVLFLDMRSFTTLAEKLSPKELVELLNSYFEIIISAILRYDGVVNKFIGDAVMVVWGAPRPCDDHALRAVQAAWTIQRAVGAFNWERMKSRQAVSHIGIGINTGEVVAGNVGTSERLEYTVIGDEVNLAQRLESLAKPGQVLVSSSTYERVASRVSANKLSKVKVKGREEPVTPYEIVDLVEEDRDEVG